MNVFLQVVDRAGNPIDPALADKQLADGHLVIADKNAVAALIKYEPRPGYELRRDATLTDDYFGTAPDGSATSDPVWLVVRHYKDPATGITRTRSREAVAWDDRAVGWT